MSTNRVGWVMAAGALVLALGVSGCRDDAESRAGVTAPALEQDGGSAATARAPMPLLAHLARKLDLTAEQRQEIRGILRREHQALRESGVIGQGTDKVHEWLRGHHEKVADEIAGLLTPAQQDSFAAMRARFRAVTADGAGRGQVLTRLLKLDDKQQAQAAALIDHKREALKGFRDEVLAGRITRAQLRERARSERQQFRASLEQILTPEQKARLAALIKEWRSDFPEGPPTP